MLQSKSVRWKERKSWSVSSTYVEVMWFREEKMRVLRGVVYMPKSKGPRSEPWGHRRRICTAPGTQVTFTLNSYGSNEMTGMTY